MKSTVQRREDARMSNVEIVRAYFARFFSGVARHSEVRSLLTDDFSFRDPVMSADSAEDYVQQLVALGDDLEVHAQVRHLIGHGNQVAALVDFHRSSGPITYAQWFTMREGKIAKLEVVYDPRAFLNMDGE